MTILVNLRESCYILLQKLLPLHYHPLSPTDDLSPVYDLLSVFRGLPQWLPQVDLDELLQRHVDVTFDRVT